MATKEQIELAARAILPLYAQGASEEWANRYWASSSQDEHRGDCPLAEHQGPITCDRCVCDECREMAKATLSAVGI